MWDTKWYKFTDTNYYKSFMWELVVYVQKTFIEILIYTSLSIWV
jgi:hypothetical protein